MYGSLTCARDLVPLSMRREHDVIATPNNTTSAHTPHVRLRSANEAKTQPSTIHTPLNNLAHTLLQFACVRAFQRLSDVVLARLQDTYYLHHGLVLGRHSTNTQAYCASSVP